MGLMMMRMETNKKNYTFGTARRKRFFHQSLPKPWTEKK